MSEKFSPGDPVVWWDDRHGHGLPADHPDAVRRTGTVASVHHADDSRIVSAYLITCRGVAGTYLTTVRPDYGHQLTRAEYDS